MAVQVHTTPRSNSLVDILSDDLEVKGPIYRNLYKTALRRTGSHADAEDLVQDTYLSVLSDEYKGATNYLSVLRWTKAILSRRIIDLKRKKEGRRYQRPETFGESEIDFNPTYPKGGLFKLIDSDYGDFTVIVQVEDKFDYALSKLSPTQRGVFDLFHFEGLDTGQIARVLKISRQAAQEKLREAKKRLGIYLQIQETNPKRTRKPRPLTDREQQAIDLLEKQGLKLREAAEVMGITIGTLDGIYRKAIKRVIKLDGYLQIQETNPKRTRKPRPLTDREQQAIDLLEKQGLTYKEAAKVMGIRIGTLSKKYGRALGKQRDAA